MKIVSLLPSATEIVFALGLDAALEGVTHECDFPAAARTNRVVSGTALPQTPMTAREVDDAVTASVHSGTPIYTLDAAAIRAIGPDLILTQDLCEVCAVPAGAVEAALETLGCRSEVVSLDPASVEDVIADIGRVGDATGTAGRAVALMTDLRARVDRVRVSVRGLARPRVLALEWSDPPFSGGHWVPEMIDAAGGEPVIGAPGERSRRLSWTEIEASAPDVVMFMPCGYGLDAAAAEGAGLVGLPELEGAAAIYALPADALFSRPGPRVVDGIELLASLLHPGAGTARPPNGARAIELRVS
jgi:iron complex transport system substrate-binding protein